MNKPTLMDEFELASDKTRRLVGIGIDPGLTGGIAFIAEDQNGNQKCGVTSMKNLSRIGWSQHLNLLSTNPNHNQIVFVEKPHFSMGKASYNAGLITGIAIALLEERVHAFHPNTLKAKIKDLPTWNRTHYVNEVGVNVEKYGNKLEKIQLALDMAGPELFKTMFVSKNGNVDHNLTDAFVFARLALDRLKITGEEVWEIPFGKRSRSGLLEKR